MNDERTISKELPGLLDALVCGELDETARGRVLAWLEEDPLRWRQCGLAFLEAQTWSQALGQFPGGDRAHERPGRAVQATATVMPGRGNARQARVRAALTAVVVLVAFVLGFVLRQPDGAVHDPAVQPVAGSGSPKSTDAVSGNDHRAAAGAGEPVLAALDMQAGGRFGAQTPIRIPVVPAVTAGADVARHGAEIPDYVRQQWERRGYKVSLERRYVFARLPDGQQVVVPVEQFHVNPVPVVIN
ncbi:MAG: hypothetical protein ACM3U2_02595 [Deltaproteobacteria bacterium]